MEFLIVMVLMLGVMWVLMIRPQRQRQRDHQRMIDQAGEGDDILTTGGIYATITRVDGDDLVVDVAEGVSLHMTRRGIAAVLPPEEDVEAEAEEAEAEEPEVVEEAVAETAAAEEAERGAEESPERAREGAV